MPARKIIRIVGPTAALVVLAVIAAFITKSVMNSGGTVQASNITSIPLEAVSSPDLRIDSIAPVPGGFSVAATASLLNFADDEQLGWYVKVYQKPSIAGGGTDYKFVKELKYDNQKFTTKKGEPLHPTFKEQITVPPGDYSAEIGLVRYGITVVSADGEKSDSSPRPIIALVGNVTVK